MENYKKTAMLRHFIFAAILISATAAVYSSTLHSPFVFDDYANIVNNGFIRAETFSKEDMLRVWNAPHPNRNRALVHLSFALNYLWGEYDPAGYHLVNIGIHICCGLLAALLFFLILQTGWLKDFYKEKASWIAWTAALIWVLHPIQINSVTYIVQRMNSMAMLFFLLAFNAWMGVRHYWKQRRLLFSLLFLVLTAVAWTAGLLCKEHVIILPFLILVCEMFLFRKGEWKARWFIAIIPFAAGVLLFFPETVKLSSVLSGYRHRDFTLAERLMTESGVLWHYVSLFYFPVAGRYGLFYDYPISRGLFSPPSTIISILAWGAVTVFALYRRKRWPVFSWMIAWFIVSHLIESTIIPLEIIFEHRMYLPSAGLALGSVLLCYALYSKYDKKSAVFFAVPVTVLLILGFSAYTRNLDFKDAETLYRSELQRFPNSYRIRMNLAVELNKKGEYEEGGRLLHELAQDFPEDIAVQQNLFYFLASVAEDAAGAEKVYQNIRRQIREGRCNVHRDSAALKNLASYFQNREQYEKAIEIYELLLTQFPGYDSLWYQKGLCHAGLQDWVSAEKSFGQALKLNPHDPPILYWYGKTLIRSGKKQEGCGMVLQAVSNPFDTHTSQIGRTLLDEECGKE